MHVFSTSSGYALALVPGLPRLGLAATDLHGVVKDALSILYICVRVRVCARVFVRACAQY